jgi:hypothetical protein
MSAWASGCICTLALAASSTAGVIGVNAYSDAARKSCLRACPPAYMVRWLNVVSQRGRNTKYAMQQMLNVQPGLLEPCPTSADAIPSRPMAAHIEAWPVSGSGSHGSGPSRMQDAPHSASPTQMVGNRPALSLISLHSGHKSIGKSKSGFMNEQTYDLLALVYTTPETLSCVYPSDVFKCLQHARSAVLLPHPASGELTAYTADWKPNSKPMPGTLKPMASQCGPSTCASEDTASHREAWLTVAKGCLLLCNHGLAVDA